MSETTMTQEQIALLLERLERIEKQLGDLHEWQESLEDLKHDVMAFSLDVLHLASDELEAIGNPYLSEDLAELVRRLARELPHMIRLLDYLESAMDLAAEVSLLSKPMMDVLTETLDRLEKEGVLDTLRAGANAAQQLATAIRPEDVEGLAKDGVAVIEALRERPEKAPSLFALLREMTSAEARRGLARALGLLKALGRE